MEVRSAKSLALIRTGKERVHQRGQSRLIDGTIQWHGNRIETSLSSKFVLMQLPEVACASSTDDKIDNSPQKRPTIFVDLVLGFKFALDHVQFKVKINMLHHNHVR
ncbi:unnamed protein product [Dovyalis caffra]|uniref:Uncharacterized protein n=1 Tax=Dovyalis caffra TaxID=77055 RepID=A0AAV1SKX0_9ROSI|nr:unnamed protein product [Dovyalis caffra]